MTKHLQTHESRRKKNGPKYFCEQNAAKHGFRREMRCARGSVQLYQHSRCYLCGSAAVRSRGQCIHPISYYVLFLKKNLSFYDLSQACDFSHTVVPNYFGHLGGVIWPLKQQKYTHCSSEPRRTQLSRTTAFWLNNPGYFKLSLSSPEFLYNIYRNCRNSCSTAWLNNRADMLPLKKNSFKIKKIKSALQSKFTKKLVGMSRN